MIALPGLYSLALVPPRAIICVAFSDCFCAGAIVFLFEVHLLEVCSNNLELPQKFKFLLRS